MRPLDLYIHVYIYTYFSYAAPFLWNHQTNTIRSASTYMSFRKNLKTYLSYQAFPA